MTPISTRVSYHGRREMAVSAAVAAPCKSYRGKKKGDDEEDGFQMPILSIPYCPQ
jgi:hypothetical protein